MEIIINDHEDFSEVILRENGTNIHVFTFDDKKQATAFYTGFKCAKQVAKFAILSLPSDYERNKIS